MSALHGQYSLPARLLCMPAHMHYTFENIQH